VIEARRIVGPGGCVVVSHTNELIHFQPMPPQSLESSPEYRDLAFVFEDRMKTDPLRHLLASILMMRFRVPRC
jgi:hypothetical protein